ncbi:MAG: sugar phosphate isomerase/epimerase [Candidatus Heimdallarchaeota archaeon]|nr:sugar phosphate isomerase/epimerase [Candidatus Heimdallarchaeota archaeon]
MVLIGQTIQAYKGLSCEHLVKFAKTLGIESCELNPQGVSFDNLERVIEAVGDMTTTFHLPVDEIDGYDFSFPDKQAEIDEVIKLVNENVKSLNILLAVFHPVEHQGEYETLVKNISQLKIPVVVENVMSRSDEDFLQYYNILKKDLGNQLKGWLFDVAHSYIQNGPETYLNLLDKMPFDELEEIHLSDCNKGEDSHYSFGAGVLPIRDILRDIKKRGFRKVIVNEIDAHPTIWHTIDSYKLVAKHFKRSLYIKVALRKLVFKPIIQRRLRKANIDF